MSYIQFDMKKCKKDGICAAECPMGLIAIDPQTSAPHEIETAESLCVRCGHCVSVCPYDAVSLTDMPVKSCERVPDDWRLDPKRAAGLLKGRRSIRTYTQQPVDRTVIADILDVARFAPTGINRQPISWTVIYEPTATREIARLTIEWMRTMIAQASPLAHALKMKGTVASWERGEDRICRNAPHLIVAVAAADEMLAQSSATIALTYVDLMAAAYGLGACWAGYVHVASTMCPPLTNALGLKDAEACFGVMMLGHAKYAYRRIPARKPLKVQWH